LMMRSLPSHSVVHITHYLSLSPFLYFYKERDSWFICPLFAFSGRNKKKKFKLKRFGLERETEAIKKIIRTKSLFVMLQKKNIYIYRIERERERVKWRRQRDKS
jgi:hypothetical protein